DGRFVGDSLVGSRTRESGEVSFALTVSCRVSVVKALGPGRTTGFGAGSGSAVLLGTELSRDPVSSLPVRSAGGVGVPNLGSVRGPPGPLPRPMLLVSEPTLLTSSN